MTLESIYYISDTVLNVKERVEKCLTQLVDEFNKELSNFVVPDLPCEDDLKNLDGEYIEFFGDLTAFNIMANIRKRFDCLYYSFMVNTNQAGNCTTCVTGSCYSFRFFPVFLSQDRFNIGFLLSPSPTFDYNIPAVLPPLDDRLVNDFTTSYGNFLIDFAPLNDLTAELFIIEVFSEYMGCASDIVKSLRERGKGNPIFSTADNLYNPYTPDAGGRDQFQLPLSINNEGIDIHGKIIANKLDEIFQYTKVGDNGGIIGVSGTPELSQDLKNFLAEAYFTDQSIDDLIAFFSDCDEEDEPLCQAILELFLAPLRDNFFNNGLDRKSLDTSIALVFGNKTTIGQVCSFAKGLEDDTVDDIPGFCCLDAPYESQEWGEKYSCKKYETRSDGSTKVVQKSAADCNTLGPLTSGFNEAACDIFHGTWCPIYRSCATIANCVKDAKEQVQKGRDRQAFYEYLNGAPELKLDEYEDPDKCGDLREYFDYDRDYPDDDRICEEVLDLQCFTDFSNLDGFATGTAGPGNQGGMAELAVSETVRLITKTSFDPVAAKVWRSSNFALQKVLDTVVFVTDQLSGVKELCNIFISCIPGTSAPCTIPAVTSISISAGLKFAAQIALDLSGQIYDEVVGGQNGNFGADRSNSIYDNVITNHGNIITTFAATQQLKVMLGEISEGLAKDEDEEGRRLLSDCVSTSDGYQSPCDKVSCEDITRICDGSFNFRHIAYLRGAGCDELDSDGDGLYDLCEDRFPPELIVRDAEVFRCDEDDTSRLCYHGKVFKNERQVKNFLDYQFPASDDCASTNRLNVTIEYERGTCRETVYKLTPVQDIPACNDREPVGVFDIAYDNPLYGASKEVTVQIDDEAPVVHCGFLPDSTSFNKIDDKTLYHYMSKSNNDGHKLDDAQFIYNVTDNCEENVHVSMVVKSNEVQQNSIAEIFEYQTEDSLTQATFLYGGTTCGNVGKDLFCKKNPSNVRFYDVIVAATDSAGNTGSDTCKVVVVSGCAPSEENCVKYNTKSTKSYDDTGKNYYALEFVLEAVAQPQTLYKVAAAEFDTSVVNVLSDELGGIFEKKG
mmetsp:Transcript_2549/g.3954  ORF Transcript_2549/g.3954 Transcript_2549/m.3954 type:complete len:1065 (-) Transcript_2549:183-3377(-)